MPSRWLEIIGMFTVLTALNLAAHAAETSDMGFSARVRLAVAAPEEIRSALTDHLKRELRSLNGTEVVDHAPEFEINVVALEIRSTRGYRGGIAISTVILTRDQDQPMPRRDTTEIGQAQASGLWSYPGHYLQIDASDRLQVMCKQIAADFDARHLEKSRRRFRKLQELRRVK